MKKLYTLVLSIVSGATMLHAQPDCSGGRYDQEIFNDFDLTSDIVYGNNDRLNGDNIDLELDVYEPTGDTETERPLIIFMHGGTFIAGSKTGDDVKPMAEMFARKGYVTASINYRLGMDNLLSFSGPSAGDAAEAVFRATQDARAAVRFFRKSVAEDGNPYGIDTDHIYLVGASAGGFMALHLAYLTEESDIPAIIDQNKPGMAGGIEGESGNAGYSSEVTAIVNLAGALADVEWMTSDKVPVLSMHGDQDETVPYDTDWISVSVFTEIIMVDGSQTVHEKAQEIGLKNCFKPFFGAGHVPHVNNQPYTDTTELYVREFLLSFVCGQADYCPCETTEDPTDCYEYQGLSTEEFALSSFNLYPNPAQQQFTIEGEARIISYQITDFKGQTVSSGNGEMQFGLDIDCTQFKPGIYLIQLNTEFGVSTKKVVIE
jgi:predicted esterase